MNKILTFLLSFSVFTTLYAQTENGVKPNQNDEAKCKKLLTDELIKRGMINDKVCLDDSKYPNISISLNNYKHQLGDENKNLANKDVKALQSLDSLLTNSMTDLKGAKKEIQGYSDGKSYTGSKYDSNLGLETCGSGKKRVTKKTLDYIKNIKDKNIRQSVDGKFPLGECLNTSSSNLDSYIDILRNHNLAFKRARDFCEQINVGISDCNESSMGMPSPKLITESHDKDNTIVTNGSKYEGVCDERRGIKYNFLFPDEVRKERIVDKGYFEPEYDIAGRDLQNNMQFSAALDFMKNVKNQKEQFPELENNNISDLLKNKSFYDVDADKKRFKELLAGSGCENNEYQIDNQRRKYWAVRRQVIKAENALQASSGDNKETNMKLMEAIKEGDYKEFIKASDIVSMASLNSIPLDQDYLYNVEIAQQYDSKKFDQQVGVKLQMIKNKMSMFRTDPATLKRLQSDYDGQEQKYAQMKADMENMHNKVKGIPLNYLKDPANRQMVLLARTLLVGVPIQDSVNKDFSQKIAFTEGQMNKAFIDKNKIKLNFKKKPQLKKYVSRGQYSRYPDAPLGTGSNAYPATDIHACNSVADAVAEYVDQTANPNILKTDLKIGDDVYLGVDNLDEVELSARVGSGLSSGSQDSYFNKFAKGKSAGKGWICKGCGSGIHVHENGGVHYVSRNRAESQNGIDQNTMANNTAIDLNKSNMSLGSLQSLKSYQIEKCNNCNCLKGLDGEKLNQILTGKDESHPTVKHEMVTLVDGKPFIKNDLNKFKVTSSDTCIFSPPVPHSCNFDPAGDSKVDFKAQEIKENLYCTLYSELKNNNNDYPSVSGIINVAKETSKYAKSCGQNIFPRSENDCLKAVTNSKGRTIGASSSTSVSE